MGNLISTAEAAKILGVSETRVRDLLHKHLLQGQKIGRTWLVDKKSVRERAKNTPRAGRPSKKDVKPVKAKRARNADEYQEAHKLYLACKEKLAGCYTSDILFESESPEEAQFYASVADFFLQQKQQQLVTQRGAN